MTFLVVRLSDGKILGTFSSEAEAMRFQDEYELQLKTIVRAEGRKVG